VDVVEFFSERPLVFCVVNLEAAVWGDVFGLDWTQICAKNLSGGEQIRCRVLFKVPDEVLMANRIQLPKIPVPVRGLVFLLLNPDAEI